MIWAGEEWWLEGQHFGLPTTTGSTKYKNITLDDCYKVVTTKQWLLKCRMDK